MALGTRANLTTSGQFKYQSRRCSSITGCTNWAFSDVSTPTVDVELAIFGDTAYVSFITGRCDKPSSGCTSSDAIPVYGANYARVRLYFTSLLIIFYFSTLFTYLCIHATTLRAMRSTFVKTFRLFRHFWSLSAFDIAVILLS